MATGNKYNTKKELNEAIEKLVYSNNSFEVSADNIQEAIKDVVESLWKNDSVKVINAVLVAFEKDENGAKLLGTYDNVELINKNVTLINATTNSTAYYENTFNVFSNIKYISSVRDIDGNKYITFDGSIEELTSSHKYYILLSDDNTNLKSTLSNQYSRVNLSISINSEYKKYILNFENPENISYATQCTLLEKIVPETEIENGSEIKLIIPSNSTFQFCESSAEYSISHVYHAWTRGYITSMLFLDLLYWNKKWYADGATE